MTYAPFGSKERIRHLFGDTLSECSENYKPEDVADAFLEELDDWIQYHHKCADAYELIRDSLRKRVSTS